MWSLSASKTASTYPLTACMDLLTSAASIDLATDVMEDFRDAMLLW